MGIMSAVASAAATQSANNTAIKTTAMTNKANKELAEQQNQWNLEQWQRENEYNHPAEQAKRLKEAGLSSAAAAQAVTGGQAGRLQSANLANQTAPPAPQIPDFSGLDSMSIIGIARQFEALRKESADADITEIDANLHEDVVLTDIDAKIAAARATTDANKRENELHPYRMSQEFYKAKSDKQYVGLLKEQRRLAKFNVQKAQQELHFFKEKSRAEIDKILQEINNLQKQGKNMDLQNFAQSLNNLYLQTGLPRNFIGAQLSQVIGGKKTIEDFNIEISRMYNLLTGAAGSILDSPIFREWSKPLIKPDNNEEDLDIMTIIKSLGAGAIGTVKKAFGIGEGKEDSTQEQDNQTPQQ